MDRRALRCCDWPSGSSPWRHGCSRSAPRRAGSIGCAPRRGRVRPPGDRRQAGACRRLVLSAGPRSLALLAEPADAVIAFGTNAAAPQGCLAIPGSATAAPKWSFDPPSRRSLRPPGADRDALPRALGDGARVPRASELEYGRCRRLRFPLSVSRAAARSISTPSLADVAESVLHQGPRRRQAPRGDGRLTGRRARRRPPALRAGGSSRNAAGCSPSATAARRPTPWTSSPISRAEGIAPSTSATTRDPDRARKRRRAGGALPAPDHRAGRDARRRLRLLDERRLREHPRSPSPRPGPRGLATVALVGYDGGPIVADGLADHVLRAPSEYIPRIQEAHATALSPALRAGLGDERPILAAAGA